MIIQCTERTEVKWIKQKLDGLNKAVASKTVSLVKRAGGTPKYMMTGGVSKNKGLVKTLEERLGCELIVSGKAQLCSALGATLFAMDMTRA